MVDKIHYRWDFIGLSTDTKPTPAESPKVVDGSTYYESDTSKLYVFYKDTWYEKTATGGGGTSYTAGEGIDITNNEISVDTETIQPKLTAGTNITIDEDNVISAEGGSSVNVVQTIGTSTTDVMSQDATTKMVFNGANGYKVQIGSGASASGYSYEVAIGKDAKATNTNATAIGFSTTSSGLGSIAIGDSSKSTKIGSIGIGYLAESTGKGAIAIGGNGDSAENPRARYDGSVAIGVGARTTAIGEFNIGSVSTSYGYNSSNYRLLTGLYDGQSAHDAVTVEQVNATIDAINTALSTSIPHIGA